MRRAIALTQLGAWIAALTGGLKTLAWTDAGALRGPSLRHWSMALVWLTNHDTVTTAFVAVRLVAMAACGYLLFVTIVGAVAELLDLGSIAAWAGRANTELARKLVTAALGAGMVVTSVAAPAAAESRGAAQPSPSVPVPPTMHRLGPAASPLSPLSPPSPPSTTTTVAVQAPAGDDAPTSRGEPTVQPPTGAPPTTAVPANQPNSDDRADDDPADATMPGPPADPAPTPDVPTTPGTPAPATSAPATPAPGVPAAAAPAAAPGPPTDPAPDAAEPVPQPPAENLVTIAPGDNLWVIAERSLAGAWHRHPSAHEVAPYWLQLVDENRSRLIDPHDPDLVFAGQVIAVPSPPAG